MACFHELQLSRTVRRRRILVTVFSFLAQNHEPQHTKTAILAFLPAEHGRFERSTALVARIEGCTLARGFWSLLLWLVGEPFVTPGLCRLACVFCLPNLLIVWVCRRIDLGPRSPTVVHYAVAGRRILPYIAWSVRFQFDRGDSLTTGGLLR